MAAIFACVGRSSTRGAFVSAATASGAGRGDDVWRMFVAIRFVCVLVKRGSCATTCVLANRGANASSDAYPLRAALLAGLRIAEMHNRATAPRESHQDNISESAACSAGDARLAASLQPWLQNSMCAAMRRSYLEFLSGTRIYTCNASITAGKNRRRGGREPLRGPVLSQITISTETSRRVRTRQKRRRRVAERPGARRPSALTTHYDTLLHTTHLKPTTPPYQNSQSPAASATRPARRAHPPQTARRRPPLLNSSPASPTASPMNRAAT